MKSVVGIYQNHQDAVAALSALKNENYDIKQISLLGKADLVGDHIIVKTSDQVPTTEMSIGVVAGSVLGVLAGMGILAIPGLGFVFGTGALFGAIVGFDIGVVGGGIAAILTSLGVTEHMATEYEKYLKEDKFIVMVTGSDMELDRAQHILDTSGQYIKLDRAA